MLILLRREPELAEGIGEDDGCAELREGAVADLFISYYIVCVCVCVCLYVYIYIYIYTHIYTYR